MARGYSSVGAFGIDLLLGSTEFVRGLRTSDKRLRDFENKSRTRFQKLTRVARGFSSVIGGIGSAALKAGRFLSIGLGVGAAAALGISVALKKTANEIDLIAKAAQRAGMSVELFQVWELAASEAGVAQNKFNSALVSFQRRAYEASRGNKTYSDAFKAVGIELVAGDKRLQDTGKLLLEVADRWGMLEANTVRVGVAANIFNVGAGAQMNLLMQKGGDAIREYYGEMKRLGLLIDGDLAASAERATDEFALLGRSLKTNVLSVLGQFLPVATSISRALLENVIPAVRQFVDESLGTGEDIQSMVTIAISSISNLVASTIEMAGGLLAFIVGEVQKIGTLVDDIRRAIPGVEGPAETESEALRRERRGLAGRTGRNLPRGVTISGRDSRLREIDARLAELGATPSTAESLRQTAQAVAEGIRAGAADLIAGVNAGIGGGTLSGLPSVPTTGSGGSDDDASGAAPFDRSGFAGGLFDFSLSRADTGYERAAQEAADAFAPKFAERVSEAIGEDSGVSSGILRDLEARRAAFASSISGALQVGFEQGGRSGAQILLENLKQRFFDVAANLLAGLFSGMGGGVGFGGAVASLVGMHRGGSWEVDGRGGTDKVLQAFMATRGERITVEPAGAPRRESSGRMQLVFKNVQHIARDGMSPIEAAEYTVQLTLARLQDMQRRGAM